MTRLRPVIARWLFFATPLTTQRQLVKSHTMMLMAGTMAATPPAKRRRINEYEYEYIKDPGFRIGIEIEGCFKGTPGLDNFEWVYDGSIFCDEGFHAREYVTIRPFPPSELLRGNKLRGDLERLAAYRCRSGSCGGHVHMSHSDVTKLDHPFFIPALWETWREAQGSIYREFAPERDGSKYAKPIPPFSELSTIDEPKYYGLNISPSFERRDDELSAKGWHVEFRVFPQILPETLELFTRYVNRLCQIFDDAARRSKSMDDGPMKLSRIESLFESEYYSDDDKSVVPVTPSVSSVAIDFPRVVVAYDLDGKIRLWDGTREHEFAHRGPYRRSTTVTAVDGSGVVSGGEDNAVKVWDLTGDLLKTLRGHDGAVRGVAMHSYRVVSGSMDTTVRIWNRDTGDSLHILRGHPLPVVSVAMDAARGRVVSGSGDKTVKVWNMETGGEPLRTLEGHTSSVISLAMSGGRVASGSPDKTVNVWNVETGELLHTLRHSAWVSSVALHDGLVLSGSWDNTVRRWDVKTGRPLRRTVRHPDKVNSVAVDSRGYAVSGDMGGSIKNWDASSGVVIYAVRHDASWSSVLYGTD